MRLFWLPLLGACFSPTPPTGVPCATDSDCPSSQSCQANRTCDVTCNGCTVDADPGVTCWPAWLAHTIKFNAPVRVEELRQAGVSSGNPSLSPDNLEIYFNRMNNLFRATRTSLTTAFSQALSVTELQSPAEESRLTITVDGLLAIFSSARVGTLGGLDLWQATRSSPADVFGSITSDPLRAINDDNSQFDPEITADGLDLYWAPVFGQSQTIHRASRTKITDLFDAGTTLAITAPGTTEIFDPTVSPDQTVIVFAGQNGAASSPHLFYSTLATDGTYSSALPVPDVGSSLRDGDAELSADGCTLFFTSNRQGQNDIYAATARP